METDDLIADALEFLTEHCPDNVALVPISIGHERDPETGKLRWACYFQVDSRRWGEFETSARAPYPAIAIHNAFAKLRREFH